MTVAEISVSRPQPGEYAEYYHKYIAQVPQGDIVHILESQARELDEFLSNLPESKSTIIHPPYTWTIKQVVSHIIDGERIFAYRLLRIARGDQTALPGFDENEYARTARVERLEMPDLIAEFRTVRDATLSLLRNLPTEAWTCTGTANGFAVSARALAWIMAGHVSHHLAIMRKRVSR